MPDINVIELNLSVSGIDHKIGVVASLCFFAFPMLERLSGERFYYLRIVKVASIIDN